MVHLDKGAGEAPHTAAVTLMFTDIQDSTGLWSRLGEAFRPVLERHNELVRRVVGEHAGQEVKSQGDSFMVAFARPAPAVECAVALETALAQQTWPDEVGELLVRIGLHSGEALVGVDPTGRADYFGPMVNLAYRVGEAGHGGQIVISAATWDRLSDDVDPRIEVVPLGSFRLRGLDGPQELLEVRHPDLPVREFPPLRTLEALRTNLPAPLTTFVGRHREVADLKELLRRPGTRLVTLTGVGGCGKTRLALEVAADVLDAYPDGVWLVELATITDPGLVAQTVATALTVQEKPERPLVDTLIDHLRDKHILLVLDNCEHLVDSCAHMAEAVLRGCPRVRIVTTSREALGVPGELAWQVPSLSTPDPDGLRLADTDPVPALVHYDGVRLFVERAALAQPDFGLTARNGPAVAQICGRLDGIPLAIELAAARVKVLSVGQISNRLDDRFRLLTGGSRTALPRQQTLQAAIDWSYDLLLEPEQTLFCRLAVFAGGWTLEAAEAVCAGEGVEQGDVLDLLAALVGKSLVIVEADAPQGNRYRFAETVRQYAREKLLGTREATMVRMAHCRHFLELAEQAEPQLRGPGVGVWSGRLHTEHGNIRSALEWSLAHPEEHEVALRLAAAMWRFWYLRGYVAEGQAWLDRALACGQTSSPGVRASALSGAGSMAWMRADYELAEELHAESLELYREVGDTRGEAEAVQYLAGQAHARGELDKARASYERSLLLYRQVGDTWGIATVLNTLGLTAYEQGQREMARSFYEESLEVARELGEPKEVAIPLVNLGELAKDDGDYERAESLLAEGLKIGRDLDAKRVVAFSLLYLGVVEHRRRNGSSAERFLKDGLRIFAELTDRRAIAEVLETLASVACVGGQTARAARLIGAAEALRETIDAPLPPVRETEHQGVIARTRSALGGETFCELRSEGRRMELDHIVALELCDETGT